MWHRFRSTFEVFRSFRLSTTTLTEFRRSNLAIKNALIKFRKITLPGFVLICGNARSVIYKPILKTTVFFFFYIKSGFSTIIYPYFVFFFYYLIQEKYPIYILTGNRARGMRATCTAGSIHFRNGRKLKRNWGTGATKYVRAVLFCGRTKSMKNIPSENKYFYMQRIYKTETSYANVFYIADKNGKEKKPETPLIRINPIYRRSYRVYILFIFRSYEH